MGFGFLLTSCSNSDLKPGYNLEEEALLAQPSVYLSSNSYEVRELESALSNGSCDPYHSGILEYEVNGMVEARIQFDEESAGRENRKIYQCNDQRGKRTVYPNRKRGRKQRYTKVIIDPLVKADGCEYLVAGSICFFKGNEWVATIDFGNGECDALATKQTKEGKFEFSLKDWDWK